jgi:hypothetical protein
MNRGQYGVTAHGDPNTAVQAVLNVPLIEEKMAVRGVIYSDRRGGYIDNVPATWGSPAASVVNCGLCDSKDRLRPWL